jgi:cob(I)alamin adenosyltransferase
MSSSGEAARARRAQIVALSLTELMLLLVFMSIAFTFLSKDEAKRDIPKVQRDLEEAQAALKEKSRQLAIARQRIQDLQEENHRLNEYIKELTGATNSISPNAEFPPPGYGLDRLRALAREQRSIISALQRQIGDLQKKVNGGRAPGLPICTVTNGYLINFTLEADGNITGAPGWKSEMAFAVNEISGAQELASGRSLRLTELSASAAKVKSWGLRQVPPCTVRVSYARKTTDAGIFERQLKILGDYFYVGRAR